MYRVSEIKFGAPCVTRVWISEKAQKGIERYRAKHDRKDIFLKRLQRYAQTGFSKFEGGEGLPIKHEWDGVYRVRPTSDLFRLIGFYESDDRRNFIVIDAFMKSGRRLNTAERERIKVVADVKRAADWERDADGGYPRVAR